MLKYAKLCLQTLATVVVLGGAANAVPITIDTTSTPPTISNCRVAAGPSDCLASVAYAPSLIANPVLQVELNGPAVTFDFLELTAIARDPDVPDLFDLTAALNLLLPGTATFIGNGLGSEFATRFNADFVSFQDFLNVYDFVNGNLTWAPVASQQVAGLGLVTVAFLPASSALFGFGPGLNPSKVLIQARISVVPLPAGVLLLGTALLGLFGLSRRRKAAVA